MRFIVIEGLDGSGKDTQAHTLKQYLESKGENVVLRVHPSQDNFFGRVSKKALMKGGKLDRITATLFFGFDVIRSIALYCRGNRTVIYVRYTMASAYLPESMIRPIYRVVSRVLPSSDEMFFLDVSPEEALRRVHARGGELEMFETLPHMERVRSKAMMIIDDWKVIDGNPDTDTVFESLVKKLRK